MESVLSFINYKVNEVRFKENIFFEEDDVTIDFGVDAEYEKVEENLFLVTLKLDVFKDAEEKNYPFSMYVELTGFFEISELVDDETKEIILKKNTVAILFPYVRSLVSTYTANANVQPLILPPINVNNLIDQE
jgi:preprotein translocase subunit SecB